MNRQTTLVKKKLIHKVFCLFIWMQTSQFCLFLFDSGLIKTISIDNVFHYLNAIWIQHFVFLYLKHLLDDVNRLTCTNSVPVFPIILRLHFFPIKMWLYVQTPLNMLWISIAQTIGWSVNQPKNKAFLVKITD